jgi:hypothetical protein
MTDFSKGKPMDLALQTLIGRQPTTEEITKFYQIRDLLGISEHDAMWTFLLAFGHYEILYRDIPKEIHEQLRQTLADHKLSLDATAQAAERSVRASLADAVTAAAKEAIAEGKRIGAAGSSQMPKRKAAAYVTGAAVAGIALAFSLVAAGYKAGQSAGAVAAGANGMWAESPQGRAAKEFAGLNPVQTMLDCPSNFQTKTEENATYCVPYDAKTKLTTGWRIK